MKHLVLAGAGHAHALVLREWARSPLPGISITVVSPQALAPYSGMVPGWLAGRYRFEDICIDFAPLCRAAGAQWIQAEVQALDASRRQLWLSDGRSLRYDVLSLNIGSTLRPPEAVAPASETDAQAGQSRRTQVLSMRPLSGLHDAWHKVLQQWQESAQTDLQPARRLEHRPFCITAVGAGAAGFESVLAVVARLRHVQPQRPILARLVSRGENWLDGVSPHARQLAGKALERAQIDLQLGQTFDEAMAKSSDLVLWAAGAQAHEWLCTAESRGGLAVTAGGFVRVDSQLRSVSHPNVLAAGDCAHWEGTAASLSEGVPKAGVYAVRMAPVLGHNLRAAFSQGDPRSYRPQRDYLVLLATADGRAIASRGPLAASGRWVWRWKHRIDTRFLQHFPPK